MDVGRVGVGVALLKDFRLGLVRKLMRVIQTIAGTQLDHGGTSRSVPALCDALVDVGVDNHLVTARPYDESIKCNYPRDSQRVHVAIESRVVRQWGVGAQFCQSLSTLVNGQDAVAVHDHAVWLASNHAIAKFCRRHRTARVVSPRGMLGLWAMGNGKWKKRLAWHLYQRADLASATAFHATSEQEAAEIRSLGFLQPIAVIPNGLDIPIALPTKRVQGFRQALFLSRIHPKKGLANLVRAWKAAAISDDWRLVIAGPDENGHQREIAALIRDLGLDDQISFAGPVDDSDKWQRYVDSDIFILPSFNENFGIVIAEAMAAGLPVITSTGTPWKILQDSAMGWWVEPNVGSITAALRDATTRSKSSLVEMGCRASAYVRRTYSWRETATRLSEFYMRLLEPTQQG